MKIDARTSIVQIEPALLSNLVKEVKETLATDITMPETKKRSLTLADLWSIQSNTRTAKDRFRG